MNLSIIKFICHGRTPWGKLEFCVKSVSETTILLRCTTAFLSVEEFGQWPGDSFDQYHPTYPSCAPFMNENGNMKHWTSKSTWHCTRRCSSTLNAWKYFFFLLLLLFFWLKYLRAFLLNTERSGWERGIGKELMLFQCSNNCQNDVVLFRLEIPFLFYKPAPLKIWC